MNDDNLEKFIEAALVANRSAIWWQTEMNKGLAELEKLNKEDPYEVSDIREELESKMEYLIAKGAWEDANLDKIMSEVGMLSEIDRRHVVTEMNKRWDAYVRQTDPWYKNNP
tara:strand:+ start:2788 stop:3123 length:336 start_codon:yes stop_codon:yes gene_type:complete